MWVSQMLAILDKPEAPAVHAILEDLTSQYPQVRYSLTLCLLFAITRVKKCHAGCS